MLGVIVCTHSDFAKGLAAAVKMIAGEQKNFSVLSFHEGESMTSFSDRVKAETIKYEANQQRYVVLVDLFGATPFNASATAIASSNASIITGVNLSLLLEILTGREGRADYDAFLEEALTTAKDSMKIVKMKEMFGS